MRRNLVIQGARNALTTSASYFVATILFLVTAPLFVEKLGVEVYGVWLILQTLESALGTLDLGLQNTTIKYLAEYSSHNWQGRMRSLIGLSSFYYLLIGMLSVGFVFATPVWLAGLFHLQGIPDNTLYFILRITALDFFVRMISTVPAAIPAALNRYEWLSAIEVGYRIIGTAVSVVLLLLGWGIGLLVVGGLVLTMLRAFAFVVLTSRLVPRVSFRPTIDTQVLADIIHFNAFSAIVALVGQVSAISDRLLTGFILGPQSLSYYTVADTLATQVHTILSEAAKFMFPLSSHLSASKEHQRLHRILLLTSRAIALASFALAIPLVLGGSVLIQKWMGDSFARNSAPVLELQAVAFALSALLIPSYYVLNGTGRVKFLSIWLTAGLAVIIALYVILISAFGLMGAALAWLLYVVGSLLVYHFFIYPKILGYQVSDYLFTYIPAILAIVPLALIEYRFQFLRNMPNLATLLVVMITYGALTLLVGVVIDRLLNKKDSIVSILIGAMNGGEGIARFA